MSWIRKRPDRISMIRLNETSIIEQKREKFVFVNQGEELK